MRYNIVLDDKTPMFANLKIENDGAVTSRTIFINDLVDVFLSTTKREMASFKFGRMPKGYYQMVYTNEKNFTVVVEREAHQRGVVTGGGMGGDCFFIPYPRLVFSIKIRNGKLSGGSVFAIKGNEPLTGTTEMYRFPFSNVSLGDGHICFGGNNGYELDTRKGVEAIDDVIDLFYNAPYNGDYYRKGYNTNLDVGFKELLEHLQQFEQFPEELLVSEEKNLAKARLLNY